MFFWHRRPKYKNEVGELLAGDFYMMVLPDEDPFPTEEVTVRSYDGDGYRCRRIPYLVEGFDTRACLAALRRRQCVALRLEGVGHVVLTNFRDFRLFLMLQRAHRCGVNYVFCAGGGGGYFKILAGGRIQRKIASFIQVGNHGSYAETRGQPCAYELETGHTYRVDPNAKTVWEMVPDFGHSEIVALLDYYVGLRHFQNENLTGIALYALEEC